MRHLKERKKELKEERGAQGRIERERMRNREAATWQRDGEALLGESDTLKSYLEVCSRGEERGKNVSGNEKR